MSEIIIVSDDESNTSFFIKGLEERSSLVNELWHTNHYTNTTCINCGNYLDAEYVYIIMGLIKAGLIDEHYLETKALCCDCFTERKLISHIR